MVDIVRIYIGVVPYVGTWIEINIDNQTWKIPSGRSLRGNVDRNLDKRSTKYDPEEVVPYVGTWIEIRKLR